MLQPLNAAAPHFAARSSARPKAKWQRGYMLRFATPCTLVRIQPSPPKLIQTVGTAPAAVVVDASNCGKSRGQRSAFFFAFGAELHGPQEDPRGKRLVVSVLGDGAVIATGKRKAVPRQLRGLTRKPPLRADRSPVGPMVKDVQRHLGKMMWRDSPDPEALAREPARQVADETLQRIRPERWPSRFALAGGA